VAATATVASATTLSFNSLALASLITNSFCAFQLQLLWIWLILIHYQSNIQNQYKTNYRIQVKFLLFHYYKNYLCFIVYCLPINKVIFYYLTEILKLFLALQQRLQIHKNRMWVCNVLLYSGWYCPDENG
jgi:hypothetical protein